MPRIENHQLESALATMWTVVSELPAGARNSDAVNDLIEYFINDIKQFRFDLQVAEVQWEIDHAEELRTDAQRRLNEMRDRGHV